MTVADGEMVASSTRLQEVGAVEPLGRYLGTAWRRRDFATALATNEARAAHVDTVLGSAWQLLNPALLVGVYYLIFGVLFDANRGVDNYLGFLVVGIFYFTYTRKSTSAGARAIINNRPLIQSVRFPRVLLPVATVLTETFIFLPSVVVMLVVALATGEPPRWTWILLVPLLVVQFSFNVGVALATSRLTVHVRDLDEVLPFLLRLWFYLSGVLYPVSLIGDELGGFWETVFELNPAYVYIELARDAVLDGTTSPMLWLAGAGWALLVGTTSLVFFRRYELGYGGA